MTASRLDPFSKLSSTRSAPLMRGRAALLFAPLAGILLAACHAGLPPEPPGADPADPAAGSAPYQVQPNPYQTSAFAGEPASKAPGHAGHGTMDHGTMDHANMDHGNMDHGTMDHGSMRDGQAGPKHSGHGATEKQPPADSGTIPPKMHKHPEAP